MPTADQFLDEIEAEATSADSFLDGFEPAESDAKTVLRTQQQAIAAETPSLPSKVAARAASGLEKGMTMPERVIRGGLDLLGYYKALDAVTGGGTKFQDYNRSWLEHFNQRDQQLTKEDEALGAKGFGYDVVEGVARATTELPTQLLGGGAGATVGKPVAGMALTAGGTSGLSQYAQDRGEGRGQLESAIYGAVSGTITGLTTAAFGQTGVEAVFRKEGAKGVANKILSVLKEAGLEGAEEAVDQFQQDLLERVARNPDKPIEQSVRDVLLAGSVGSLIGGAARGVSTLAPQEAAQAEAAPPVTPSQEMIAGDKPQTVTMGIEPEEVKAPTPPAEVGRGLGAAKLDEVAPAGTGLKNATGALEREQTGLPEAYPTLKREMLPVWEASGQRLAADPKAGEKLAAELKINPERGMTDEDSALLLRHKVDLENRKNQAAEDTITATSPEAKQEAQNRFDALSDELLDLLDAAKFRGTQWGREGRWRQAIAFEDFSLETMRRDARLKADRELTPEEESKIKQDHDRIADLNRKAAKVREESDAKERGDAADTEVADVVREVRKRTSTQKKSGVDRDLEAEQKSTVDYLKDHFIERGELVGAERSIRKLMELLVEREGITERLPLETRVHEILLGVDPTLTRENTLNLMSGYGRSKVPSQEPHKKIVRDISQQIISVRKLLDYFKGKRPSLTGILRDAPSDIQRAWLKMVNEAKKNFKLDVPTDNVRSIKSAVDAINTRLRNRISDLKQEIATRQKIIRERSPSPYNDETIRLRQELETLLAQHAEIFGSGLTPAQQLARAEKVAERQIAEVERQIRTGEIFPKTKQALGLRSEKLDAAKARLEELKLQRQFAREALQPRMEPHEQFLLNYLLRVRQREAQYRERLARGDFAKKVKPPREITPEVAAALADVEKAKNDFRRGLYEYEMGRRSRIAKIWGGIKQARNAYVNIMSSYDFSAPRQAFGAILSNSTRLLTNPVRGTKMLTKPFQKMFRAWSGERKAGEISQWIKDRPNAKSGADKIAGIQYTSLQTQEFTKWEENAHSVLDDWAALPLRTGSTAKTAVTLLPKLGAKGVRASNRAFITFLNVNRALLFDELLRVNFADRAPTEAELKVVGNLVNLATGRGALKPGFAKAATEVLWAPSLLASRVQLLTGQPFWGKAGREGGRRAQWIAAKEYARMIMAGTILLAISRLFDDKDEDETTSSDYGKIVRGETRIDPWAGFQQVMVLEERLRKGEMTSSSTGQTRNVATYGTGEILWNFIKNKSRPDIAAAVRVAIAAIDAGKDEKDVRVTPGEALAGLAPAPLALQEVVAVMRDRGMSEGAIISALAVFGVGVSVHEDRQVQK